MLPYRYRHSREGVATLTLSATQPSLIEPLSLAEVKQYLRVDFADDDALISTLISGAREQAEYLQGRVLVRKSFDLTYNGLGLFESICLATPTVSVDTVELFSNGLYGIETALVEGNDYEVNLFEQPARVHLTPAASASYGYSTYPTVRIQFTAGYAPTDPFWSHAGARLKAGMLLLISAWYGNRLPFAGHVTSSSEYPFAVTHCLTAGALRRVR